MRGVATALILVLTACTGNVSDNGGGDGGGSGSGDGGGGGNRDGGGGYVDAAPVVGEDPGVAGIVAAHNAARAAVSPAPATPMPALTWSSAAFDKARAWAAGCNWSHNPNLGSFGENIFATSASTTGAAVVQSWVSEKANYNYAANSCSGVCGHYTQVVWAATTAVGCAKQRCTTGSPLGGGSWEFWVCDYSPPGNFGGQRPY